jgi:hypothetical protein
MRRMIEVLQGHWTCHVTHAPSPQMPGGATSFGWEDCRVGPGGASILFDTLAHGEFGTFEGAGVITGNAEDDAYELYSLTSLSTEPGLFTGCWRGGDVVFDGYEYVAGQRLASRHSITDIGANSFVYTIEMGSAPDDLRRTATIRYSCATARRPTPQT